MQSFAKRADFGSISAVGKEALPKLPFPTSLLISNTEGQRILRSAQRILFVIKKGFLQKSDERKNQVAGWVHYKVKCY